jgi:hypothetical protein
VVVVVVVVAVVVLLCMRKNATRCCGMGCPFVCLLVGGDGKRQGALTWGLWLFRA